MDTGDPLGRDRDGLLDDEQVLCMVAATLSGCRADGSLIRPGVLAVTTERLVYLNSALRGPRRFAASWRRVQSLDLALRPRARLTVTIESAPTRYWATGDVLRFFRLATDRMAVLGRGSGRPARAAAERRLQELRERLEHGRLSPDRYDAERARILART